jgi:hypothetical protein
MTTPDQPQHGSGRARRLSRPQERSRSASSAPWSRSPSSPSSSCSPSTGTGSSPGSTPRSAKPSTALSPSAATCAVQWERPASSMPAGQRTWRDYIPWPHLYANDIHVGNPAGMPKGDIPPACASSRSRSIPSACSATRIHIPVLRFDGPRSSCCAPTPSTTTGPTKNEDKKSKWDARPRARGAEPRHHPLQGCGHQGRHHGRRRHPLQRPGLRHRLQCQGHYNGAPVGGGGKTGGVLSLKDQDAPFPVQADVHSGEYPGRRRRHRHRPASWRRSTCKLKLAAPAWRACTPSPASAAGNPGRSRPRAT